MPTAPTQQKFSLVYFQMASHPESVFHVFALLIIAIYTQDFANIQGYSMLRLRDLVFKITISQGEELLSEADRLYLGLC